MPSGSGGYGTSTPHPTDLLATRGVMLVVVQCDIDRSTWGGAKQCFVFPADTHCGTFCFCSSNKALLFIQCMVRALWCTIGMLIISLAIAESTIERRVGAFPRPTNPAERPPHTLCVALVLTTKESYHSYINKPRGLYLIPPHRGSGVVHEA